MIPGSIGTFWCKGSAGNKEKLQVDKKTVFFSRKCSPDSKADFRGEIFLGSAINMECVEYDIAHITYNINYLIYVNEYIYILSRVLHGAL